MYEDDWMVTDRGGPRRLKAIEQARMLGFGSTHFDGLKPTLSEDEMGQFVAAAFPVLFVARLLVGLAASAETCRSICLLDLLCGKVVKSMTIISAIALGARSLVRRLGASRRHAVSVNYSACGQTLHQHASQIQPRS